MGFCCKTRQKIGAMCVAVTRKAAWEDADALCIENHGLDRFSTGCRKRTFLILNSFTFQTLSAFCCFNLTSVHYECRTSACVLHFYFISARLVSPSTNYPLVRMKCKLQTAAYNNDYNVFLRRPCSTGHLIKAPTCH